MRSVAEIRILPSELSYRVLQMLPTAAAPDQAARAVERYLYRKHSGLAQALEISAGLREVIVRAWGEAPEEMLREARELLSVGEELGPEGEIEVAADEFRIELVEVVAGDPEPERDILHSKVRYFPHPVCEWFEISMGDLVLTDQRIAYEPEYAIMAEQEEPGLKPGAHLIPLREVRSFWRGDWWDIPCLMLQTPRRTYRYGWPAKRGELETILDVSEWLERLRSLLAVEE